MQESKPEEDEENINNLWTETFKQINEAIQK